MPTISDLIFVDSDEEIRALFEDTVKEDFSESVHIHVFKGFEEASRLLQEQKINGVILDGLIYQPELTAFITKIRGQYPRLPIIVLASYGDIVLDQDFMKELDRNHVRVVDKVEGLQREKTRELFAWCQETNVE